MKKFLRIEAPIRLIKARKVKAGFLKNNKTKPRFIWLHLSKDQIIHRYNAIYRGYLNYYYFVSNYGKLSSY